MSSHPNKPCNILQFKEITLMLDCGLSAHTVLNFLPLPLVPSTRINNLPNWMPRDSVDAQLEGELKECCGQVFVDSAPEFGSPQSNVIDFSEVDVILISNYLCMLALPYITEGTGFEGVVYATEPTLQIGRLFMEELVKFVESSPQASSARHWKDLLHLLPLPLSEADKPKSWRQIYDTAKVNASLARIQMVGYNEELMDQTALKNADVLILTGLTQTPTTNPDSMLGELCMTVAMTLRSGGSVLIPCYPSGVVYDIFECLSTMTLRSGGSVLIPCYPSGVVYDIFECLSSHLDNSGLSQIPMFFVSPVADSSLAYSNILAEWLSQAKQKKVYLPEEPFPHAFLVKNGRLKHFKNLYAEGFSTDYRQPCVVFCGHPSLRFGDSVHFVELWGSNPLHTIIFTEPDFPYLEALAPFQPLAMKAVHCPIDTSLNFHQAKKLIRDLKPTTLVLPHQYTLPPPSATHRVDLVIESETPPIPFKRGEVLSLPLRRRQGRVGLEVELAGRLMPTEVRPGVALSTLTGALHIRDNRHVLKVVEDPEKGYSNKKRRVEDVLKKKPSNYTWGTLDIDDFIQKITQEGITDAKVEQGPNGYIIHLQNEDTLIQVEDHSTHIYCEGDEQLRLKLRNILLQCLNKF
ncbi:hypothetical protein J437_LFUL015330 [Ladona fulva]|uniref:Beta-Casp domain-containing protein n=1 Tax=Ladona fulva TaxID=123851 RepID=A0A8K0P6I2_LADFU|nr:hypothetical protein J437_LFUL015330 [Ladona fulva]